MRKGSAPILVIGLEFALFILGIAIYFKQTQSSKFFNPLIVPTKTTSTQSSASASTANWKTYFDPVSQFSIKYPEGWTVKEGPKQVSEKTYDYEYLRFTGTSGEILVHKANQLGGGCTPAYEQIQIKSMTTETCHYVDDSGNEVWTQIKLNSPLSSVPLGNYKLIAFATAFKPISTNRATILEMLSSMSGAPIGN